MPILLTIALFILLLLTDHGSIMTTAFIIGIVVIGGAVAGLVHSIHKANKMPVPDMMPGETAAQYRDRVYRAHNLKNPWALRRERNFNQMTWQDFERAVEAYFNRLGWATMHTGQTGDKGVDIMAFHPVTGESAIIQCKHYNQNVGSEDVQKLAGAMMAHSVKRGFLVTNADFTQQAREFASMCAGLELINGQTLAETWEGIS
jgi:restriction endonuclease Mrr